MAHRIGLVTCADQPQPSDDDAGLLDVLAEAGLMPSAVIWNDPSVHWERFDTLVLRSCWDYHEQPDRFRAWLDELPTPGPGLWNRAGLVRWNIDKTYLRELAAPGVEIPRTTWLEARSSVSLAEVLAHQGLQHAVVKPTIAATAWKTFRTEPAAANRHQARLDDVLQNCGAMVQEFLPQIETHGEWSLIFFAGEFSHAVLKRARAGDFRVQGNFGGTVTRERPPDHLVAAAAGLLEGFRPRPLYARVDGVLDGRRFVLLELELIEPELFFRLDEAAAQRFVAALVARL